MSSNVLTLVYNMSFKVQITDSDPSILFEQKFTVQIDSNSSKNLSEGEIKYQELAEQQKYKEAGAKDNQ